MPLKDSEPPREPERAYIQRDGKRVTIDPGGEARRFLISGQEDPDPIAGLESASQRARERLFALVLNAAPLTAEAIAFAHPTPDTVAAFNRALDDYWKAKAAFTADRSPTKTAWERGGPWPSDNDEVQRLWALLEAIDAAGGWIEAAIANIAEAAR